MSNKNNTDSQVRKAQLFFVDLVLTIGGTLSIAAGLWSVYRDSATMAATCLGSGLVLLFAATIQRFEFLKGLGMEAKVNHLDATINQAEKALAGLKELTELSTESLIILSSSSGRQSGPPSLRRAQDLANKVKKILTTVDAPPETVARTLAPWILSEAHGLAAVAANPFLELLERRKTDLRGAAISPDVAHSAIRDLQSRADDLMTRQQALLGMISSLDTPDIFTTLKDIIATCPELTGPEKTELASDLRPFEIEINYLVENKEFRDISFWSEHLGYRR
jgi:hypothetical protein